MNPAGTIRERISPVDFYRERVLPRLLASPELIFAGVEFAPREPESWRVPCPFRPGRCLEFLVDPQTLHWQCEAHDCGSGDGLDYLARREGLPMPLRGRDVERAVRLAAALAGVDASDLEAEPTAEEAVRRRREDLLLAFLDLTRGALFSDGGKEGRAYLERCGFVSAEDQAGFGLLTLPDAVRSGLEAAGFTSDEVEASGLLKDSGHVGSIVVPWRDHSGRLETFATLRPAGGAGGGVRHVPTFGGARPDFFGLDVALRYGGRDRLVIVEAVLDALLLQARGMRNVAAICGGGDELTASRWEALARLGVRGVVLMLNDDDAGRAGTFAALENADQGMDIPAFIEAVDPAELAPHASPAALVQQQPMSTFNAVLRKRLPGYVCRSVPLLRGVTPGAPEHARENAAMRVLELASDQFRRGGAAGYYAEPVSDQELLGWVAAVTGYGVQALTEMAQGLAKRGRREAVDRQVEVARERARVSEGRASGWEALDRIGIRFNPGELTLVGARAGHGVTSFLVGLLHHWLGMPRGELLAHYSLEKPEGRVFHRLLALQASASEARPVWSVDRVRDYLRCSASAGDWESYGLWPSLDSIELARGIAGTWENRLSLVHCPSWDVNRLAEHARGLSRRRPVGAVLVDDLQLVPAPAGAGERGEEATLAAARRLKQLAMELGAPVVAGVRMRDHATGDGAIPGRGRPPENEQPRETLRALQPGSHDFRPAGLVHVADLVLGLLNFRTEFEQLLGKHFDPEGYIRLLEEWRVEVGVVKLHLGDSGKRVALTFAGGCQSFRDPGDVTHLRPDRAAQ